jgi:hypothetical protein
MAYKEDGKDLENYAGFMGDGFEPMPALYHDTKRLHHVAEWPQEMLDERLTEYGQFLQKENLMPRAEATANRTMNHLLFEAAFRDGIYDNDLRKVEDETCTN